ncbi:hypothetical protein [Paenibacillus donghaensis]|uniref:PKD domain-containing protein n=1 Tax=Paenibacillus donghaensis TaxID=414771 RepID=A0A2Z2K9Q4_9BACL|nr:hypothetical protein [Paenibacillus donghaensis]ASA19570.1 hypothetical protein B9T62_01275 [Paenibacillus donghaensis]
MVGHAQGRKYEVKAAYYYTADAKVTTYSYGGTVTFDYALPTEPTLTGTASILKPNPNPAKFDGKDVPVQLNLKGELAAYADTGNISEWVLFAKEKGKDNTLQTKKDYSKTLSSTRSFDFTIPKGNVTSDRYEQDYDLTVVVRFSKPVSTKTGTVTSLQESFTKKVEVMKNPPLPSDPPIPKPELKPPVPVLDIPDVVMAGEEFMADGQRSHDPDGTIVEYHWSVPGAVNPVSGKYDWTWYPIDQLGWKRVTLRVVDNDGLARSTSGQIEVIQPVPKAVLQIKGIKKENRKVTVHNISTSPEHYPIVAAKTVLTITPVSGGTAAAIKYSGDLNAVKDKDMIFKKAGTYKATLTVTNTAGFSDTTSQTFDIIPDEPPVVYFSSPTTIYRDPGESNLATASLSDMSFSPDFDILGRRLWEYRYDSNNNGSFNDEAWNIANNENNSQLQLKLHEVGRYEVKLTVFEEFDQPTLTEFVTEADRRSADSNTSNPPQLLLERTITVQNRAPEVDWAW